jgi:pimeloyl-ACP methyl ester carboxylesterase
MNRVVLSADGVAIHYEVTGSGNPTLVFVHGWSGDQSQWSEQVAYFSQQHQVVTVDLGGHGKSGLNRKKWTMAAFGADVVAVMDTLHAPSVVLIGHSMGGPVIVEAARHRPERIIGLVGVDTFTDVESDFTPEQVDALQSALYSDFVGATRALVKTAFASTTDPKLVEQISSNIPSVPPEVGISALLELRQHNPALRQVLREIKVPLVAINSDYRPRNVEGARRYGIDMMFVSQVGHFVMMEDAETFNQLLTATVAKFTSS